MRGEKTEGTGLLFDPESRAAFLGEEAAMPAERRDPWVVTLDLIKRCDVMPPGGITPENLASTLVFVAEWFARIAARSGAQIGRPFEVTGTEGDDHDDTGVVIGTVTLDGDGEAKVVIPDGTVVVVVAESFA